MPSVFTRIISRELPAKIFYETDRVIVIADHRPIDAVHLLIIPKEEHLDFFQTPSEILKLLNDTVRIVAKKLGIENHFRLIINNGYGQEIDHVHYHFISNRGQERLRYIDE